MGRAAVACGIQLQHLLLFLFLQLDNLTLLEIRSSGAFLTQALDHMYKLRTSLQAPQDSQSQDF